MASIDKDIERLIVRRLDGEISEDEDLELNRELIRNPDARRLLEEYGLVDEIAADALSGALTTDRLPLDAQALPERSTPKMRGMYRWAWQLATGAIAASLLAVFVARVFTPDAATTGPVVERKQATPIPVQLDPSPADSMYPEGLIRNVGTTARPKIRRNTGREVFGVVGEDGSIYWIGVDRTRTTKVRRSERM